MARIDAGVEVVGAPQVRAEQDQARHLAGISRRVGHGREAAREVRQSRSNSLEPVRGDHRLEVAQLRLEAEVGHAALREAGAAGVVLDVSEVAGQALQLAPHRRRRASSPGHGPRARR